MGPCRDSLASQVSDQWQMYSMGSHALLAKECPRLRERIGERRIGMEGGERQSEGVNERELGDPGVGGTLLLRANWSTLLTGVIIWRPAGRVG